MNDLRPTAAGTAADPAAIAEAEQQHHQQREDGFGEPGPNHLAAEIQEPAEGGADPSLYQHFQEPPARSTFKSELQPSRSALRTSGGGARGAAGEGEDRLRRGVSWHDIHAGRELVEVHEYEPSSDGWSEDNDTVPQKGCCSVQ